VALPEPSPDSTALVTGASAGIGAAFARSLARRGHGVTLVARRKERLEELAEELAEEHGVRTEALACDLADPDARDKLAGSVEKLDLTVEVLVNNAGFGTFGRFARADRERQVEMVRLNIEAVVDLTARYLPGMVERGRGAVINVASTASFQPLPNNATYAASKAFVQSFTEAVHSETQGKGVAVTALYPGPVKTEFTEAAGVKASEEQLPAPFWTSAEQVAEDGVRAAERGRRSVVPGMLNRAGSIAGRHVPRTLLLPLIKRTWGRVR
jgi:uncharacterized protein